MFILFFFKYTVCLGSDSPIPSRLSVKQAIKSAHLAWCDTKARQVCVCHADSLNQSVQSSFGIFPNLVRWSPENYHGVAVRTMQELIRPADHPENTGVSYHPQRGSVPYISVIPQSGGIVHTNYTLCAVNLLSCSGSQDMAGARHQRTVMATQVHGLGGKKK